MGIFLNFIFSGLSGVEKKAIGGKGKRTWTKF